MSNQIAYRFFLESLATRLLLSVLPAAENCTQINLKCMFVTICTHLIHQIHIYTHLNSKFKRNMQIAQHVISMPIQQGAFVTEHSTLRNTCSKGVEQGANLSTATHKQEKHTWKENPKLSQSCLKYFAICLRTETVWKVSVQNISKIFYV